ncbi:MAG: aspartate dehydrogenase [Saccharospirillum sp.]|uniref:aspartate dehydrogenase n=1 Tax=Saccharospirillum sp. TaxID=2033801 RepID=UPI0032972D5D
MTRIGIIGFGTAGQDIYKKIQSGAAGSCRTVAILVRDRKKYIDSIDDASLLTNSEEAFFRESMDVVVEVAGHASVSKYGKRTLECGRDLVIVSVGALNEQELYDKLISAARESGRRVYVPSAAVAGLDRIAAASQGQLDFVRLTTRKPLKAWRGTYAEKVVNLDEVTEPVVIYEGNARESSRLFPESVNVSAALSLAGVGFERTEVRVIADPTINRNIHEITAAGHFGSVRIEVENTPSPSNPKTGYIVAMSVCKVLKGIADPLQIGI